MMEENGLKKGPWTSEEDRKLVEGVQKHGHGSWKEVAKAAGLNRCGKSCRLRWMNYLRPDIKRGAFTCEEETAIIDLHAQLGNKWSVIARYLPGRTDNEIKNFWNSRLKKKLFMNGIDPNTHTHLDNTCLMLPQQPQLLGYCNTSKHDLTCRESHEEAIAAHVARILLLGKILQFLISSATPVLPLEASSPIPAATNGPRWERSPGQIEALTCLQPSFHNCTNVMEINTTNSQGFGEYYSSTHYEATTSAAVLEDHILMDEQPSNYYWNL